MENNEVLAFMREKGKGNYEILAKVIKSIDELANFKKELLEIGITQTDYQEAIFDKYAWAKTLIPSITELEQTISQRENKCITNEDIQQVQKIKKDAVEFLS